MTAALADLEVRPPAPGTPMMTAGWRFLVEQEQARDTWVTKQDRTSPPIGYETQDTADLLAENIAKNTRDRQHRTRVTVWSSTSSIHSHVAMEPLYP